MELEIHPLAHCLPRMPDEEFEAFKEDISGLGVLEPITLLDGMILDGRHRYRACQELDIECPTRTISNVSPHDLVRSMNLYRRHLNESQRAMVAAALLEPFEKEAKQAKEATLPGKGQKGFQPNAVENLPPHKPIKATDKAGKALGVSGRSVRDAKVIRDEGTTEEIQKVSNGKASVSKTAKDVRQRRPEPIPTTPKHTPTNEEIADGIFVCKSNNGKSRPVFNRTNENISWAGWSWNPATGCLHGCEYCYARDIACNKKFKAGFPNKFEPTFLPDRLAAPKNTHLTKEDAKTEGMRRVFVCSMADLFGAWVPPEWIQQVIDACEENQQWDFLFLTKNPKRYLEFAFPLNCWLGATADTQERVDKAISVFSELRGFNGPHRDDCENITFLSLEPLLESIVFNITPGEYHDHSWTGDLDCLDLLIIGPQRIVGTKKYIQPKWQWVESLIEQSVKSDTLYVFKQHLTVQPENYPESLIDRSV